MLTRRLVVCLDVRDGRVVKGVEFVGLRDVGDPVELAARYMEEGADEIVFLDITATDEERATLLAMATRAAERLFVPLTIGGGIRNVEDVRRALRAGADKVAINSAAVRRPEVLTEAAREFGAQCVVASIDARRTAAGWEVYVRGGKEPTGLDAVQWAVECARRGAGEILLTSIDRDGTRIGYDLELTRAVAGAVSVPVVASGGAGEAAHVTEVLTATRADAALVAGILHDGVTTVPALKQAMRQAQIPTRGAGLDDKLLAALDFTKGGGLVTVVAQDDRTGAVLMVAHADREAIEATLRTGEMHYRSRTRGLWHKGATSGHIQRVISLTPDCDGDAVLARVISAGPACHTGSLTCFGDPAVDPLDTLAETIARRAAGSDPGSYTKKLLDDENLRLKKLGEEATELAVACAKGDSLRAREEGADLVYHALVALQAVGVTLSDVRQVLANRARPRKS